MPRFRVFCYLSYCLVISEPAGSVVWCLTLTWRKFSVIIVSNCLLHSFLLLVAFLLCIYYTCYSFPTVLGYFVAFSPLCFVCSFVLEIFISPSSKILSSAVFSLLIILSKAFKISVSVFWSLAFLFVFLRMSISLLILLMFLYAVYFMYYLTYQT